MQLVINNTDEKTIETKNAIEALKKLKKDTEKQKEDMNKNGIKVYGIKLIGKKDRKSVV